MLTWRTIALNPRDLSYQQILGHHLEQNHDFFAPLAKSQRKNEPLHSFGRSLANIEKLMANALVTLFANQRPAAPESLLLTQFPAADDGSKKRQLS